MNIKIYQLNEENSQWLFCSSTVLENAMHKPSLEDYDLVYEYDTEKQPVDMKYLDSIYAKFNYNRPEDFMGHSLSIGDLIAIDDDQYWFVDSFGFTNFENL